jgi:hypothetical protein
MRYQGVLSDVLSHPTLYKYYPKFATMPLIYFYGNKEGGEAFYFSENERGGFIIINGSRSAGDSLSILLHETQHAIQNLEKFATGGNLFLAQFVASIGSANVRKVFASINKMQHYFRDELLDNSARLELMQILKGLFLNSNQAKGIRQSLYDDYMKDYDTYKLNYKNVNFMLVLLVAEEGDYSSDIIIYLSQKIGNIVYNLFENISSGYEAAKNYKEYLSSQQFRAEDIQRFLFNGYESLYGEIESRSVQHSRFVQSEYKNYFYLKGWENDPLKQITVIDSVEEIIDCNKIIGACEDKDGEYVLHFKRNSNITSFIHELGHIVYDALLKLGYGDRIKAEFEKQYQELNIDEFFVNYFVTYIKYNIDVDGVKDIELVSVNEEINKIMDEFFTDETVGERLKYLQDLLSLI